MKNHFLRSREIWLWLIFHLGIPALLGFSLFFIGPVRVNTLFLDMLPQSAGGAAAADQILGERNGREAIVLAAAPDFESAKKGAVLFYDKFENSQGIEKISFYFDTSGIKEFTDFIYKYRFVIAGDDTINLLETGRTEEIAFDALARAYGAFNFTPIDNIDKDPFLLTGRRLDEFLSSALLSGGNLSLKEDVLAANKDDTWYVMLRLTLSSQGVSLDKDKNIVAVINTAASSVKEFIPGLEFYFSGVPFHSYESSSSAQKEIAIISALSISIILFLFFLIFRSLLPVFLSVLDALISLAIASGAALLIFREIHIITFVFGTALIGTCVDYSIHFFVHWKKNQDLKNGYEIRSHISKSIIMCFISTEICFLSFLFAPFPILKQFAVFAMTGLTSSFLTAFCIYPLLKKPPKEKRKQLLITGFSFYSSKFFIKFRNFLSTKAFRFGLLAVIVFVCLGIIFLGPQGVKIENDIRSLYTMSPSMMESEKRASQVLNFGSSPWYFIVSGRSQDETLENEENLVQRLKQEVLKGNLDSFIGTSAFVPSVSRQKKTYEAMKALLPMAGFQYENLNFPKEYEKIFYEEFVMAEEYCLPEEAPAMAGVSNLWIGKVEHSKDAAHSADAKHSTGAANQTGSGEVYYSCVLPINPGDQAVFRKIAEEFDFVFFINKVNDISSDLNTLTRTIMLAFLVAYLVISVIIFIVYPWWDSLKICVVPVFLCLVALTVLAVDKIPVGFFSIAALVLAFGLGLDYIFYMVGGKQKGQALTSLAVLLSFLTTLLSFGALAFSSFMPVHIFGLTVSGGITAALISTLLVSPFLFSLEGQDSQQDNPKLPRQ